MCAKINSEALFKRFSLLDIKWGANEEQIQQWRSWQTGVCVLQRQSPGATIVQHPPPPHIRWQEIHCATHTGWVARVADVGMSTGAQ